MFPAPAPLNLRSQAPEGVDRRLRRRYPGVLEVQYKSTRGGARRLGSGTTIDISSCGVLFRAVHSLPAGSYIELTLKWPFLLNDVHPLKLVMRGRVVRSDGKRVAVRIRESRIARSGLHLIARSTAW